MGRRGLGAEGWRQTVGGRQRVGGGQMMLFLPLFDVDIETMYICHLPPRSFFQETFLSPLTENI